MAKIGTNKLITQKMRWHANFTEKNHLGKALMTKPHVFENHMNTIFTAQQYSDNPLTKMLTEAGSVETINSTDWEWKMKGATTRPLVSKGNPQPTVTQPGKNNTSFLLLLDENWFKAGDVLHPGTSDKSIQVRIMENPYRQGNGWVYRVSIMSDDPSKFVSPTYLAAGQKWAKLYAQYGEGSFESGSTQFAAPFTLKNRMGRFRKQYSITGDAHNEILAVKIPDSNGKLHDSWIKYAEVEYWQQWYREMERAYWYSRSTNSVLDSNGRPLYSGPGIQEQLEDSNVHYYSHLTATLIEEYLMDIFYSRVKPGQGRKIKAFTGEYGMIIFHRAIQDWMQKKGFIQVVDQLYINKESSDLHENALGAGFQYVKYRMANGAELELIHNPLYDDREINFEIDPVTGYPVESMRFTFLDFSGDGVASNIKKMKKNNEYKMGYINGLQSPYGPVNNGAMAHSGDMYEMHVQDMCGIHIEDIAKCGELILKRQVV